MFLNFIVLFFVISFEKAYSDDKAPPKTKIRTTDDSSLWWSNGEIPFYINRAHFGRDQIEQLQKVLATLAEKTCLTFILVARQDQYKNTLVFQNPDSVRRCIVNKTRHYEDRINYVELGYKCLEKPNLEMKVMQALGFSFEHNRPKRDIYIKEIIKNNIEKGFEKLFEKDKSYPEILQSFRYDINSVMHFSDKDFSKNGHRTFVLRDPEMRQYKSSFTDLDIKKIKLVYQDLCKNRYRSKDFDTAKYMTSEGSLNNTKDVNKTRMKRSLNMNLRINRSIKPLGLSEKNSTGNTEVKNVAKTLLNQTLPLVKEVQALASYVKQNDHEIIKRRAKPKRIGKRVNRKKIKDQSLVLEPIKQSSGKPRTVELTEDNKLFYKDRKWPGGEIFYHFDETESSDEINALRKRMKEVIKILDEKTCVRMKEVDVDDPDLHKDYLVIDSSDDFITGCTGGRQRFGSKELFDGDQHRQHTAMMIMSMLGFYFETSRHDRDDFVKVHKSNILPGKLHHFDTLNDEATLALPYDYESATHPSWNFWRKRSRSDSAAVATLKKFDPDGTKMKSLGQNPRLLSNSDIIKINSLYGVDCFK